MTGVQTCALPIFLAKTVYSAITGDFGGLHLSELYTDNMVLQHGEPLAIRGKANAGEKVTVSIAKQKLTAKAASNGDWTVTIQPLKAGGPYTLTVSAGKQYGGHFVLDTAVSEEKGAGKSTGGIPAPSV